jgi:hypothetical protein
MTLIRLRAIFTAKFLQKDAYIVGVTEFCYERRRTYLHSTSERPESWGVILADGWENATARSPQFGDLSQFSAKEKSTVAIP